MAVSTELPEGVNPDGTRKPTPNEIRSAMQSAVSGMLADGASKEDIEAAFDAVTVDPVVNDVVEVLTASGGTATNYTTPSAVEVPSPDPEPPKATSPSTAKKTTAKK